MTKLKSNRIIIILPIIFFWSCNKPKTNYLSKHNYDLLNNLCSNLGNKNKVVYYFDGDCSMCLAKVKFIDRKLRSISNLKPVFIAQTPNPGTLNIQLKNLGIQSCVYIDSKHQFEKILRFLSVTRVNTDRSYTNYDIIVKTDE